MSEIIIDFFCFCVCLVEKKDVPMMKRAHPWERKKIWLIKGAF